MKLSQPKRLSRDCKKKGGGDWAKYMEDKTRAVDEYDQNTHTHTNIQRERERERARPRARERERDKHVYTRMHTPI